MNNINKDNEKDISVNLTHKSNFLLVSLSNILPFVLDINTP